jgi:hypothetical protein
MDFEALAKEPLHPDLVPFLNDESFMGTCLKHPLVFSVPLSVPGLLNKQYEQKCKAVATAIKRGDHHTYVFLHERPYRFEAMTRLIVRGLEESELYELVRTVWIDSENIWQNLDEWRDLLSGLDGRWLMFDDEREELDSLTEPITVYRGVTLEVNEEGLSWTLNHEKAKWFAQRFTHRGQAAVIHGTVTRENVVALFKTRGEEEIVALDEHVNVTHYEELES